MKRCSKCGIEKPVGDYSIRRKRGGFRTACKPCRNKESDEWKASHREEIQKSRRIYYEKNRSDILRKHKAWRESEPHKALDVRLRKKYGITADLYNEIFAEQNGVCAICEKKETATHQSGKVKRLHVDHDHETDEIRGLLCTRCNMAIGYMKDDYAIAEAIATYLRVFRTKVKIVK